MLVASIVLSMTVPHIIFVKKTTLLKAAIMVIGSFGVYWSTVIAAFGVMGANGTLTLTKSGVSIKSIFGNLRSFSWHDIESFYVMDIGLTSRIDIQPVGKEKSKLGSGKIFTAYDYPGYTHRELVDFLNDWQRKNTTKKDI